jgi:hypothetical protein
MTIQSASAAFTRFFVPEPTVEDFWTFVDESLKAGRFDDFPEGAESAAGFASWDDLFDSSFEFASYHRGEYAAFHYRVDQRKVSAIVLKQHVRQAVQTYRKEHEGRGPSRLERQKIREDVRNELLARMLPQPSGCDVVWHPSRHWLLVGTTSLKMIESFLEHFERHFRLYPVPLYHAQWAMHLLPLSAGEKDRLASLVPLKSPHAMHEGCFLGYEFLTWLWFLTEAGGGTAAVDEGRRAELTLGERIVLSRQDDGRERIICTTQAGALHEARTALQQGKLVEEIQMAARVGDNDYQWVMDRDLWGVKGLKIPRQSSEHEANDPEGRFLETMYFLEEFLTLIDALFLQFLKLRLNPGWESDALPQLKRWIEGNAPDSPPF